jgi:methyl-accepting chemotaxis protein
MAPLRNASIRSKLLVAIMATTAFALVTLTGVLLAVETTRSRATLIESTETIADLIAVHSTASLLFDDAFTGSETLAALRAEPDVLAAAIYRANGDRFAEFSRSGKAEFPNTPPSEPRFEALTLEIARPILDSDELIGHVFVRVDTRGFLARSTRFVLVGGLVTLGVLGLAAAFASALQRSFTRPLMELVDHSRALTDGDLTGSVPEVRGDELGELARAFNAMGGSLRNLVSEIRDNMSGVSEAADELRVTSASVVEESRRQLDTVNETAASIHSVSVSVEQVARSVEDLAERGNLASASVEQMDHSIALVADSADELARAIDGIAASVGALDERAGQVTETMSRLDVVTTNTEHSVQQQADAIAIVAERAVSSRELSDRNALEAERGMQSVQDTIAAIREIESSFSQVVSMVDGLAERSRSIGEIVRVIEDVADETQLLSLNAAIIAAQAGENGHAFAVVASQVKELAARTGSSTREIADLVGSIQTQTQQAVASVADGGKRVADGVQRSREAGDRLRSILDTAESSREQVGHIADAAASQRALLSNVESAMAEVRSMVEQTRESLTDQRRASSEIRDVIGQVGELGRKVKGATAEQRDQSAQVAKATEHVAHGLREILAATGEQRQASASVDADRVVFHDIAEENARRASGVEAIVNSLTERAAALSRLVGRFRT